MKETDHGYNIQLVNFEEVIYKYTTEKFLGIMELYLS